MVYQTLKCKALDGEALVYMAVPEEAHWLRPFLDPLMHILHDLKIGVLWVSQEPEPLDNSLLMERHGVRMDAEDWAQLVE